VARAQAPAGTVIVNRAASDYVAGIAVQSSTSNPVSNAVMAVYALGLSPPGTVASPAYSLSGAGGDTLYCRFTVDNLGNAPDSAVTSYQFVPPSTMTPSAVIFFLDANGNGVFDAGEDDPAFLSLPAGGATALDVGVVVPAGAGGGDAWVEIAAASTGDTTLVAPTSVFRVTSTDPPPMTLHIGPRGNPRALPGGEGSGDDETPGAFAPGDLSFVFENDVLNAASVAELVEVVLPDTLLLPAGVQVSVADSVGQPLPLALAGGARYTLGSLAPGETRLVRTTISGGGLPLDVVLTAPLPLLVVARSAVDTTLANATLDRLLLPQQIAAGAVLTLDQAFREGTVSVGDVATLVVTVTNISDSLLVDNVVVTEMAQPLLDFSSSPQFAARAGRDLIWQAGALGPGETKRAVVKFVANARVSHGTAKVVGGASATASTGVAVTAPPVVSQVRIDNDVFAAEGVILGEVFVDADADGRRDDGERGVPEAAVYLESGEYAVTDSLGRFSLPRAFSAWRVVRLDEQSLPDSVVFAQPLDEGEGPRANERVVHLLPGGNARVSFPLRVRGAPTRKVAHTVRLRDQTSVHKRARLYRAFVIPRSFFGLGRASLGAGTGREMWPIVEFLAEHPDWGLLAEGHTDSIPIQTAAFPSNYELSVARAESARDWFVSRGVEAGRIVTRGYGERRPLTTNETIEGRRMNRRVELSFIPPDVVVSSEGEIARVSATVRDLSALPDTFYVTSHWELTSTAVAPREATLRIDVPPVLRAARVEVRDADGPVARRDGVYRLTVARSRPATCVVSFVAEEPDTAAIAQTAITFDLGEGPVTVHPVASEGAGAARSLVAWTEAAPAPVPWRRSPVAAVTDDAGDEDDGGPVAILEPGADALVGAADQIPVRARVPVGSRTTLSVNGGAVDESRLGERSVHVAAGRETLTWYGVRLAPGWNEIVLSAARLDGTVDRDTVRVARSSQPREVVAARARYVVPADGSARPTLRFDVIDAFGLGVADGVVATVIEGAEWVETPDARPATRDLQVVTQDGYVTLAIAPRRETGRVAVAVECEGARATAEVSFVSPQRPLLATGVIDVSLGAYKSWGAGDPLGLDNYDDGVSLDAEARMFVRGAGPYGTSVTARVDTKKRFDDPLEKDLSPERQYPVYGDGSSLHFAAPAQGGNYVSVERDESYARYGDFRTPLTEGEFLAYRRATTGFATALLHGPQAFKAFVAKTDFATHKDVIPADGTSGFYYLSRKPIVENSERIVIETRDRFQHERVLDVRPMVRHQDYTINPFDGSILFKQPVAAFDAHFNPNTIVALYEMRTSDSGRYLYGARGDFARDERYRVGAAAVSVDGDGQRYALYGTDGEFRARGFRLGGEVARSEDDIAGAGNAYKLSAGYERGRGALSLYHRRVDGDFHNPSFTGSSQELASRKSGLDGRLQIVPALRLNADAYRHRLFRTGEELDNARAMLSWRRGWVGVEAGARAARSERDGERADGTLSIVGASVGKETSAGIATVWEKNLGSEAVEEYPDRLKTLGALPLGDRVKLVASHEYLTAPERAGSHQFTAGAEGRITRSTSAYSKYSLNRLADDTRMGAVSGVKQNMRLGARTAATLGLEGFASLSGNADEEYVAVKTGVDRRIPGSYFVEGQYEYRWDPRRHRNMVRLNAAQQVGAGLGWVLKNTLSFADVRDDDDELSYHGTLAGAYRSPGSPVHALGMMRNDYERYTPVDPEAIRWRLVLSADVNTLLAPAHEVRAKYAFKHVEDWSFGVSTTTNADLVLGQYIWRFASAWDADLWGRWLGQRGGSSQTGVGVEVGRTFLRAVRVALGYSLNGLEDPDFVGTDAWSNGFGVRVQLILSDWLAADFERLRGEEQ
jgi:outer membrane protein OmpA-like peptidoglycan-associated protein